MVTTKNLSNKHQGSRARDDYVMGCHGLSWVVMGCHGFSWVVMGCHGLSWVVMGCHGFSWVPKGILMVGISLKEAVRNLNLTNANHELAGHGAQGAQAVTIKNYLITCQP